MKKIFFVFLILLFTLSFTDPIIDKIEFEYDDTVYISVYLNSKYQINTVFILGIKKGEILLLEMIPCEDTIKEIHFFADLYDIIEIVFETKGGYFMEGIEGKIEGKLISYSLK